MGHNRRFILAGVALPFLMGAAVPKLPEPALPGLPDPGLPDPGLPIGLPQLTGATHQMVLTQATADALAGASILFSPAQPAVAAPGVELPSNQVQLSIGSITLDLLTGTVHFDGGFTLAGQTHEECETAITFTSFASQLAGGLATALITIGGAVRERIPVFSFDLTQATLDISAPDITLGEYPMTLTDEAVAAIKGVLPGAPLDAASQFANGSATGTYSLLG